MQICTLLIGDALAGPKFVGTARGALLLGDEPGEVRGDTEAWADGDAWTPMATGPLPRFARTTTPKMPSRITIAAAAAAGTNHGGRSEGPLSPARGGRGTVGFRSGTGAGVQEGACGGAGTGGGATGVSATGVSATATPAPSGSAGADSPGFQTGASTGVHVCWAGGGSVGAGEDAGGDVANAGGGGTFSKADGALEGSGSAAGASNEPVAAGASVVLAIGFSTGSGVGGGASDQVGTAGGLGGVSTAGEGSGTGAGAGTCGKVIAGIDG